jgi:hypothetical protein
LLPWQYGLPVYELVPQSVLAEQVMFWFEQLPLLQVWLLVQVVFS